MGSSVVLIIVATSLHDECNRGKELVVGVENLCVEGWEGVRVAFKGYKPLPLACLDE